jgi:hypothetical protein
VDSCLRSRHSNKPSSAPSHSSNNRSKAAKPFCTFFLTLLTILADTFERWRVMSAWIVANGEAGTALSMQRCNASDENTRSQGVKMTQF